MSLKKEKRATDCSNVWHVENLGFIEIMILSLIHLTFLIVLKIYPVLWH